jgi:hypothetical protein
MKNSNDLDNIENANGSQNLYRRIQGLVGEQSFSLILPKQYAINLRIRKGDFVKVRQEENKIIIEKA